MNEDIIRTFANQASEYAEGLELNQGELTPALLKARDLKFAELIIGHATECVRDVLRDENSDLSYEAASQVQNRIKEYFGVE